MTIAEVSQIKSSLQTVNTVRPVRSHFFLHFQVTGVVATSKKILISLILIVDSEHCLDLSGLIFFCIFK